MGLSNASDVQPTDHTQESPYSGCKHIDLKSKHHDYFKCNEMKNHDDAWKRNEEEDARNVQMNR